MIQGWMTPWLLVAVPALGSVLSLLLWSSLHRMKTGALTTTVASLLVVIGVFDVSATVLIAFASTKGVLPVVAVGGSMYPAFTIALAHSVLGERLARLQWTGVFLALAGVAMIAAGS